MKKKTLFALQGVGGKNGREGRCIQVPSPLQVSCSKEKPYFLCQVTDAKMYTGELRFISMAFFKSFALFRHRTSKKSLFFLKGDRNRNVQKEISFCSQGLHQFCPASASILCKNPSFPEMKKE
jgi:hypothetical protein